MKELEKNELMGVDGGCYRNPGYAVFGGFFRAWESFIDGFNDGSGANCQE